MQNIKKILIFSMLILSSTECFCLLDGINEKAAKVIAPHLVGMAEGVGAKAAESFAPAIVDATKALADSNVEIAKIGADLGEKAVQTGGVITTIFGVAAIIWASFDSFVKMQPISKEIYEYYYPTEEQIAMKEARTAAAKIKLKNLKIEEKFLDCIMNTNSKTEKNSSGCPIICEEAAILFAAVAGEVEVDRMVAGLNKYRK